MQLIFLFLQKIISKEIVKRFHISQYIPQCDCIGTAWETWFDTSTPHPEWTEWEGCGNVTCSDSLITRTRKRKCVVASDCVFMCCPCCPLKKSNIRYYYQENFEPCKWIPQCGKLKYKISSIRMYAML